MRWLILAAAVWAVAVLAWPDRARPSRLVGEVGVLTAPYPFAAPFRYPGGEIVCYRGAIGYRAPGGMIMALNAQAERLALEFPTSRAWATLSAGLDPAATPAQIEAAIKFGETTC